MSAVLGASEAVLGAYGPLPPFLMCSAAHGAPEKPIGHNGVVGRVADRFRQGLERWLTPSELYAVRLINGIMQDGRCASHDFCDPNELMLRAIEAEVGVVGGDLEAIAPLWNEAWQAANLTEYTTFAGLLDQYEGWRLSNDLPDMCCDQLAALPSLSTVQQEWLSGFKERWRVLLAVTMGDSI